MHSRFRHPLNPMGRLSDTTGERSGIGLTVLRALRGTEVKAATSKLRAVIKHFYNKGNSISLFSATQDSGPLETLRELLIGRAYDKRYTQL